MVIDLIIYIIIPPQKSSTMSFENLYPQIPGYAPNTPIAIQPTGAIMTENRAVRNTVHGA